MTTTNTNLQQNVKPYSSANPDVLTPPERTYADIDNESWSKVGTPEHRAFLDEELANNPILAHNAKSSIQHAQELKKARVNYNSTSPLDTSYRMPDEAMWHLTVGNKQGVMSQNEDEVATNVIRQQERTRRLTNKLLPIVADIVEGQRNKDGVLTQPGYGAESASKMGADLWADEFERRGAFASNQEKEDFLRYTTPFDTNMRTSVFGNIQRKLFELSPVFKKGEAISASMSTSRKGNANRPFRFTQDDEGLSNFEAYSRYVEYQHLTGYGKQGGANIFDVFANAIGMGAEAVYNIADPYVELSEKAKSDPVMLKRAITALEAIKKVHKQGGMAGVVAIGDGKEKSFLKELSRQTEVGAFPSPQTPPVEDIGSIITDPNGASRDYVLENQNLFQELLDLKGQGAFSDESRVGPIASGLDGVGVGLAGMGEFLGYSTNPNSAINNVKQFFGDLALNTEGMTKEEKLRAQKMEMMKRINSAISVKEDMADWQEYGMVIRTRGGKAAESYFGDIFGLTGNARALASSTVLADPFFGIGLGMKAVRALRAIKTQSGLYRSLIKMTNALNTFKEFGSSVNSSLRPLVDNVKATLAKTPKYAGRTLTDMDVLEIVSRGEAQIVDALSGTTRTLSKSELAFFETHVGEQAARVTHYHNLRAKALSEAENLAGAGNKGYISQYGKWVSAQIPDELRGFSSDMWDKIGKTWGKLAIYGNASREISKNIEGHVLNKPAIWGTMKWGVIGTKIAAVGGTSALIASGSFISIPAAAISAALFIPDLAAAVGFAGMTGKYASNFIRYFEEGKHINGSIAAARVADIETEITRLRAIKGGSYVATEAELKLAKAGKLNLGKLTDAEVKAIDAEIELGQREADWNRNLHATGIEGLITTAYGGTKQLAGATAVNSVMMNLSEPDTEGAFSMSIAGMGINKIYSSISKNVMNAKNRKSMQLVEFHNNFMRAEPVQGKRMLEAYIAAKKSGTQDYFVDAVNTAHKLLGPNAKLTFVNNHEMSASATLLDVGYLLGEAGADPTKVRQAIIAEAQAKNLPADEIDAYVQQRLDTILRQKRDHAVVSKKLKKETSLKVAAEEAAIKVDEAHLNEIGAINVLQTVFTEAGLDPIGLDGKPVAFTLADVSDVVTFGEATKRIYGVNKFGVVDNAKVVGLFGLPKEQYLKKFEDIRHAIIETEKVKSGRLALEAKFAEVHGEWETLARENQDIVDEDSVLSARTWLPGTKFIHNNYGAGTGGVGTVVVDGVYIVDKFTKDGKRSSEILFNPSEMKFGALHEEIGHAIFMSQSFEGFRNLIERNMYGRWHYDVNDKQWLDVSSPGEGLFVERNPENGKIELKTLRIFAESFADNLPDDYKTSFMAKFNRAEEIFGSNPEAGMALLTDVTNEMFAKAYRQRMGLKSPASAKILGDPSTSKWNWEGSTLFPVSGEGKNLPIKDALKILLPKLMLGDVTTREAITMYQKLISGNTDPMTPRDFAVMPMAVEKFAQLAAFFGRDGQYDRLATHNMADLMKQHGIDSDVFSQYSQSFELSEYGSQNPADKGFLGGKLYDKDGQPYDLPKGIKEIMNTVIYQTRRRLMDVDENLMNELNVFKANGEQIDVWPEGTPRAGEKFNEGLYFAARRNKIHWWDGKTGKLRNMHEIIQEEGDAVDRLQGILISLSKKGDVTSFMLEKGMLEFNSGITKEQILAIRDAIKKSGLPPDQASNMNLLIANLAADIAKSSINGESAGRLPVYTITYQGVEHQDVGGKVQRRVGGFRTERTGAVYGLSVEYSGIDINGRPNLDVNGNQVFRPFVYAWVKDTQSMSNRIQLAFNGTLKNEEGTLGGFTERWVRRRFNKKSELEDVVNLYLEHISSGGQITSDLKQVKFPAQNAVKTFEKWLHINRPDLLVGEGDAAKLAEFAQFVVGVRNSEYILTGKMPEGEVPGPMQEGARKIYAGNRSINRGKEPIQPAKDENSIITKVRFDRLVSVVELKDYNSGKLLTTPWSPFADMWAKTSFASTKGSGGWRPIDIAKNIKTPGIYIPGLADSNPEVLAMLEQKSLSAIWIHDLNFKILKGGDDFHVYDSSNGKIGVSKTLGDAKQLASSFAKSVPVKSFSKFDTEMSAVGLNAVGLDSVNRGGFIRRKTFLTEDKNFMIKFSGADGTAEIIDNKLGMRVASGIRVTLGEGGAFELQELRAGIQLAYDNITVGVPIIDFNNPEGASGKPLDPKNILRGTESESGISHPGVESRFDRHQKFVDKYGKDFLEFIPVAVSTVAKGKKMFARTNPMYYKVKARFADMYGQKGALEVINKMKADLGEERASTDSSAVAEWAEKHIKQEESAKLMEAQQAAIDAQIKAEIEASKGLSGAQSSVNRHFTAPLLRMIGAINESRTAKSQIPITRISPAESLAELNRAIADHKRQKATAVSNKNPDLEGVRAAIGSLGQAKQNLLKNVNDSTVAMWRNSAGYYLTQDLVEMPTLPMGFEARVNVSWLARKWTKNPEATAKLTFRVYNPAGTLLASYKTQREADEKIMELIDKEEQEGAKREEARKRGVGGKRPATNYSPYLRK